MLVLQGCPAGHFDRTAEFKAKVREGQPVIQALEAFHRDTGKYPKTLAELAPKYLPNLSNGPTDSEHYFGGWRFYTVTNYNEDNSVTYDLSFFMGKGWVAYRPTNWIANDDGHERVLSVGP